MPVERFYIYTEPSSFHLAALALKRDMEAVFIKRHFKRKI